jgi:glycogen debranching enzyme
MFATPTVTTFGSTFVISSENGDINPKTSEGFYTEDTRFLSGFKIFVDSGEIKAVSSDKFDHSISSFYTASSVIDYLQSPSTLSIVRDRMVESSIHEDLTLKNHSTERRSFKLEVLFDCDFADVFEVRRGAIHKVGQIRLEHKEDYQICFAYQAGDFHRETWVSLKGNPKIDQNKAIFDLSLAPKEVWKTCIIIFPVVSSSSGKPPPARCVSSLLDPPFGTYRRRANSNMFEAEQECQVKSLDLSIPQLLTEDVGLKEAYSQAISDLGSLKLELIPNQYVLAAGLPWFMTLFGRDSIIAAMQTKILGTSLLTGTLRTLATLQATAPDKFREAEPGKIPHEVRRGELSILSKVPHSCYYGSVDATPLFVMLLWEAYQWTGDEKLLNEHITFAESALNWIDRFGDLDGDGFVEYKSDSKEGLKNQGWKDSDDSITFASGELAEQPIALAEVQGYVYAAKKRMAKLYRVIGNNDRAEELESEAKSLKEKFNKKFWMADKRYYATALDGDKRQVDSVTSNPGHCLWTEIIDNEKATAVVQRMLEADMFTGWGIRTLSSEMARYNPLSYHNGSVWPHDNSIIASGMSRYGFFEEASTLAISLIDAATAFPERRLPELFAGYVRRRGSKPVPYPAANSPQAWASGALIYCLESLLGMAEFGDELMQRARPEGTKISLNGVVYRGRRFVL